MFSEKVSGTANIVDYRKLSDYVLREGCGDADGWHDKMNCGTSEWGDIELKKKQPAHTMHKRHQSVWLQNRVSHRRHHRHCRRRRRRHR